MFINIDIFRFIQRYLSIFIYIQLQIAHNALIHIDVYNYKNYLDNALFTIDVRKKYREILNMGFEDIYRYFNDDKIEYTFWDYMSGGWAKNNGMRIDHFLVSTPLLKGVETKK